ncbi:hypothetical protein FGB62_23g14 [Gracilaria domingensis]|nr:hypothetical protein FGB62_23g14 [Gracilaria domingensis]
MFRSSGVIRRACARQARLLHEDSSRGDFLGFSISRAPASDARYGMDMTRAPGYEVAADEEPPRTGNQKLADFASRHGRLSASQVQKAKGYLWVGTVLYPAEQGSDVDVTFTWEIVQEPEEFEHSDHVNNIIEVIDNPEESPVMEAKRRYSGGQARRIRKERARNAAKKAVRRANKRPIRKPENDVPDDEGS